MEKYDLDKELYKLLEENDLEQNEENLNTLKKGLCDGSIDILDATVIMTEDVNDDNVLVKILENNGFDVDEANLKELEEGLESGDILLTEGIFRKWKNKLRARKRMKQLWKEGKAGPQVRAMANAESENNETKKEE